MTAILTVQGLEKRFGRRRVLAGASFAVHERDRIGMIGANGAGKSTLLQMLVAKARGAERRPGAGDDPSRSRADAAGVAADYEDPVYVPDDGLITWKRDLVLEYVPQEPALDLEATVAATLARTRTAGTAEPEAVPEHEIATIAAALKLPPMEARVGTLSLGERRRVALAHALLGRADVLALDEPTNHLDATTVEWLESRLAAWPGALICVTHDRYFLDRVATRILEVDRGKVYSYEGDYAAFLLTQAERLATEAEAEYQRVSFIRREIDWIRRAPPARTTKAKARIDRFDAAVGAAPGADDKLPAKLALRLPVGPRLGGNIVELERVTKSLGGKLLVKDLSLVMKPGDRIGIVGENGAGKTTLIRMILGELSPDEGRVILGKNTMPAYFEQGRSELRDELTVLEEVGDGNDFVELPDGERLHVRGFLRMMAFPDTVSDTKVGQLSGGERNRVQLARLLRRGGNLLVLDEPTNDLDLPTLGALEEGLTSFGGCALIVSHDRWFLDRVATAILAFEGDGRVTLYEGSYSFYAERRPKRAAPAAPVKKEAKAATTSKPRPRKLTFNEARELEGMEDAIAAAEARVAELEQKLSDPETFKQGSVQDLVAQLDRARAEVERLFARWQELDAIPKQ